MVALGSLITCQSARRRMQDANRLECRKLIQLRADNEELRFGALAH